MTPLAGELEARNVAGQMCDFETVLSLSPAIGDSGFGAIFPLYI